VTVGDLSYKTIKDGLGNLVKVQVCILAESPDVFGEVTSESDASVLARATALAAALPSGGGGAAEDITFDDADTPNMVGLAGPIANVQELGAATEGVLVAFDGLVASKIDDPGGIEKGDLLVFNGTIWNRLPVGTDGQILSAASGETTGLLWIDP